MLKPVICYVDGACSGNPGPGGWAVVIKRSPKPKILRGGKRVDTTNQRMELLAAVKALTRIRKDAPLTIVSDSEYVVKGVNEVARGVEGEGMAQEQRQGDRQPCTVEAARSRAFSALRAN